MRVLVVGAGGQLGRALVVRCPEQMELGALTRADCDITDGDAVLREVGSFSPDVIINAAAFTAVDKAEEDEEGARLINVGAVEHLVEAARRSDARVVHVSTDFVFSGLGSIPYRPSDEVGPVSVYGRTKLEGERVLRKEDLVVRTAWLYDTDGANFMNTMLRLFATRDEVRVVSDQIGTPTFAGDLADAIWRLVDARATGVQHYTNAGIASWYDFAVAIKEEALAIGVLQSDVTIVPIPSEDYPTPARRPHYSVLDCRDTYSLIGGPARHWRAALRNVLKDRT